MLLEAVIAVIFITQKRAIGISNHVLETLSGLGLGRIVALGIMITLLVIRDKKLRSSELEPTPEEQQSLLGNGQGPTPEYGAVPAHGHAHGAHAPHPAIKPATGKPPGVQGTGWLDYFAGFRILFPYLW